MTNKRAARGAMTKKGKAFDDWARNPPAKYKAIFKEIEKADKSSNRHSRQSKSALRNLKRNVDAFDRELKRLPIPSNKPRSGIRGTGGLKGSKPSNYIRKFKRKRKG